MALLSFPPNPSNGDFFPVSPPAGTNVYQWDSTTATWRLIGSATGVTPGIYGTPIAVPEITVDAGGRISFAQNLPIQTATTSQIGLVQLTDDTVSNDSSTALTAAQGFYLQSQVGNISLLSPPASNLVSAINSAGGPTGVTPGVYGTSAQIGQFTINSQGRITAASNVPLAVATSISTGVVSIGSNLNITGAGLLSVPTASTAVSGVTQLVDDTTTNDSTKALTAAQGYNLQQQITTLENKNNLTFAGSLNAFTGFLTQVTPAGASAGFSAGSPLPFASPLNNEFFVVVDTPGTYVPPGGIPTVCSSGDWFLSDGTQWLFFNYNTGSVSLVNTGVGLTGGPITTSGTISLSNTGVLPGSYTNANITVNAQGRITAAANGSGGGTGTVTQVLTGTGLTGGPITTTGTISLSPATTSVLGGVIPDGTTITVQPNGTIAAVSGGVGTLQAVTDNGATTTNQIDLIDSVTTNVAISLDPLVGTISVFPQAPSDPGFYVTPSSVFFGNSSGTISAAGTVPLGIRFNGSLGMELYTSSAANAPIKIRPGDTTDTVTFGVASTTVSNPLQVNGSLAVSDGTWNRFSVANSLGIVSIGNATAGSGGASELRFFASGIPTPTAKITAIGGNATFDGQLIASGLSYPTTDGAANQVLSTNGTGTLGWLSAARVVAVPANSATTGSLGEIAFGTGFFYWHDGTQWLRVAGSTF